MLLRMRHPKLRTMSCFLLRRAASGDAGRFRRFSHVRSPPATRCSVRLCCVFVCSCFVLLKCWVWSLHTSSR